MQPFSRLATLVAGMVRQDDARFEGPDPEGQGLHLRLKFGLGASMKTKTK